MKIGICGNVALEALAEALDRRIQDAEIFVGRPDGFRSELSEAFGDFATLDMCIIFLDWRDLAPTLYHYALGDDIEAVKDSFDSQCTALAGLIKSYRAKRNIPFLFSSPITDWYAPAGFIDRLQKPSQTELFAECQKRFNDLCRSLVDVFPVDMEELANRLGKDNALDESGRYRNRAPFALSLIDAAGQRIADTITQLVRYPLKCLILDCDNTLWGGILGESGIDGILLSDKGPGKAFKDFQAEIVRLYRQGVLLVICSKNTTCEVLEVLERHKHMLIRPNMVASFRINWDDKPGNIAEIAKELNIGLDSMMFVDDARFEREFVKAALPEVEIFPIPDEPDLYADTLRKCTRFWPVAITSDDASKTAFFQQDRLRKQEQELAQNREVYLQSLDIRLRIAEADEESLPRAAQLFNKTNQFNLTTKRYSQSELSAFSQSKSSRLWTMSMEDRFGEFGIIASALVVGGDIDSFVLSCRAFGRKVEFALLSHILKVAAADSHSVVTGTFKPTLRNSMTRSFYKDAGFRQTGQELNDTFWEIDLAQKMPHVPPWIHLEI